MTDLIDEERGNTTDLLDEAGASPVQEYAGTEEDAMATAKRRMAERDAEYSAKFGELTGGNAAKAEPVAKSKLRKAPRTAPPKSAPVSDGGAVADASTPKQEPAVSEKRAPEMTAPAVKAVEEKARKASAAGDVKFADVKGGLRSLKGDAYTDAHKKDRGEYVAAWKGLN